MDVSEFLNELNDINLKQTSGTIGIDEFFSEFEKLKSKPSSYGRHYNKVITLPKTETELRMYIHSDNRQLVAATISTSPIKHGYQENQFVKHYKRAGITTIYPHELKYLAKLSGGDFSKYRELVRKKVGFAMANSEINELTHRAVKGKSSECMCAIIERADEQVKVYTK